MLVMDMYRVRREGGRAGGREGGEVGRGRREGGFV